MVLLRPRASVGVARVEPRQIQFVVDDPVERVFEGAEDQGGVELVARAHVVDEARESLLGYPQFHDLGRREVALDRAAEAHDVQHAWRGPEQRAQCEPSTRIGCLVVLAVAPAHFEVITAGEVVARRPGRLGHVSCPNDDARVPAVAYDEDGAQAARRRGRRIGTWGHGRSATRRMVELTWRPHHH